MNRGGGDRGSGRAGSGGEGGGQPNDVLATQEVASAPWRHSFVLNVFEFCV